jgi:hypothetical protein
LKTKTTKFISPKNNNDYFDRKNDNKIYKPLENNKRSLLMGNSKHQLASDDVDLDLNDGDDSEDVNNIGDQFDGNNDDIDNDNFDSQNLQQNSQQHSQQHSENVSNFDSLDDLNNFSSSQLSPRNSSGETISTPTTIINPTEQDRLVRNSLRKTALNQLGDSLSFRGGISPGIMIIHFIICALMVLNLAKYGTYSSFIHKVAYFATFLLVFIIYSIIFLKKVIDSALGTPTALGKLYL